MKASIIQRMMARNRYMITDLEETIQTYKTLKWAADADGDVESEYSYHNQLSYYKKWLVNMVAEQKALKQLIKEI